MFPARSWIPPDGISTSMMPSVVAVTVTVKSWSFPLLVMLVQVTVAVESERSTSAQVKVVSFTSSLNATSKVMTGLLVGSAWVVAWSMVTSGGVVSPPHGV